MAKAAPDATRTGVRAGMREANADGIHNPGVTIARTGAGKAAMGSLVLRTRCALVRGTLRTANGIRATVGCTIAIAMRQAPGLSNVRATNGASGIAKDRDAATGPKGLAPTVRTFAIGNPAKAIRTAAGKVTARRMAAPGPSAAPQTGIAATEIAAPTVMT